MRPTLAAFAVLLFLLPSTIAHTPPGPKTFCETSADVATHDYQGVSSTGNPESTPPAPVNGDSLCDAHAEYGAGSAYLAADNGGTYASGAWAGASWGSVACLGEDADHTPETAITVVDASTGGAVAFDVASDYARDSVPPTGGVICGDHVIEPCTFPATEIDQVDCNANDSLLQVAAGSLGAPNSATPDFPPGQNGAYIVLIGAGGTAGHVFN